MHLLRANFQMRMKTYKKKCDFVHYKYSKVMN